MYKMHTSCSHNDHVGIEITTSIYVLNYHIMPYLDVNEQFIKVHIMLKPSITINNLACVLDSIHPFKIPFVPFYLEFHKPC